MVVAKVFNNWTQMQVEINAKMEIALRKTVERLLQKLKDIILEEVYSYPSPNGAWDNRTYQFLDSWTAQEPYFVSGWYQEISQNGFDFLFNDDNGMWSHGSPSSGALSAQELDDIINDGLSESNFNFPAIEARPYWDMFQIYVDTEIYNIFRQECVSVGLPIESSVGITATFT